TFSLSVILSLFSDFRLSMRGLMISVTVPSLSVMMILSLSIFIHSSITDLSDFFSVSVSDCFFSSVFFSSIITFSVSVSFLSIMVFLVLHDHNPNVRKMVIMMYNFFISKYLLYLNKCFYYVL